MGVTRAEALAFIRCLAEDGGKTAKANNLPVGAMLACACQESMFGTSKIYQKTGNPFNLQKWPHIKWPVTSDIFWSETKISEDPPKFLRAPFNCATSLGDAVRQWCEWILHYGDADGPPGQMSAKAPAVANTQVQARRDRLLGYRTNVLDFTFNLPLVGFGENQTEALRHRSGGRYLQSLKDFGLQSMG
jgi:hypothetical protein